MTLRLDPSLSNIVIAHISDLHIKDESSIALSRIPKIAGALGSKIEKASHVILIISGDLAFSGEPNQYGLATSAIETLMKSLKAWNPTSLNLYVCPGNHDCDFSKIPATVQKALIKDIQNGKSESLAIAKELVRIQAEFNLFRDVVCSSSTTENDVVSRVDLNLDGRNLCIYLINSAWSSSLRETPGALRMPAGVLPDKAADADLSIAVTHHPLNWYLPEDGRYFADWLDRSVDMAFWGHEHLVDEVEHVRKKYNSTVRHFIAKPMEDKDAICGISCISIDAESGAITKTDFEWGNDANLNEVSSGAPEKCPYNPARFLGKIRFTPNFQKTFIDDTGAFFSHPRSNRHLKLQDIFVEPEFREIDSNRAEPERIDSSTQISEIMRNIFSRDRTIIFGPEQSGKTTFSKNLIVEARSRGIVPVYLDVQNLTSSNRGVITGWLNSALAFQFEPDCLSELSQLDPAERMVIIDNLHAAPAGSKGVSRILERVNAFAGKSVVFSSDSPSIAVISADYQGDEESAYWIGAAIYELLPLGHKRRGELIRKWVSIGKEDTVSQIDIEREVRQTKVTLDTAMGKNFIPKFPIFVLIILQQLEGARDNRSIVNNGSHAFLFEALITKALDTQVTQHPINTVRDFLAMLAHHIWTTDSPSVSAADLNSIHMRLTSSLISVYKDVLIKELVDARMLWSDTRGIGFRYPYLYYYFMALWISKADSSLRKDMVNKLVEFVHTERSANILIFLAHFGCQGDVLASLLPLARNLYVDVVPGELSEFSALSLRFRNIEDRQVLLLGKPEHVSDHHNEKHDGVELESPEKDDVTKSRLDDGLKFNTTTKTIQILGQILRSRASGIPPEEKIEIATESIRLSRRMMSFLYALIHDSADTFVLQASDAFERGFKIDKTTAIDIANRFIGLLVIGIGRTCVARVSESLASAELTPLIDRLMETEKDEDSQLILLVAKLAGEKDYPDRQVNLIAEKIRKTNILSRSILRWAVARRFYLDPPEHALRDRVCSMLDIEIKKLTGPQKTKAIEHGKPS